jgi:hypothetical protein
VFIRFAKMQSGEPESPDQTPAAGTNEEGSSDPLANEDAAGAESGNPIGQDKKSASRAALDEAFEV